MKFDSAIACLQIALDNARNNEPIQRQEGRIRQADLNAEHIVSYEEAIKFLQQSQIGESL